MVARLLAERTRSQSGSPAVLSQPERSELVESLLRQHAQRSHAGCVASPEALNASAHMSDRLTPGTLISPPSSAGGSCDMTSTTRQHADRPVQQVNQRTPQPPETGKCTSPRNSYHSASPESPPTLPSLFTTGASHTVPPPLPHLPSPHPTGPLEVDPAMLDGSHETSPVGSSHYESASPMAQSVASSATRSLNFASDLLVEDPCSRKPREVSGAVLTAKDLVQPSGNSAQQTEAAILNGDLTAQDAAMDRRRKLHALRGARARDKAAGHRQPCQAASGRGPHPCSRVGSTASQSALLETIQQRQV
jgi:hypothetical protein